MTDAALPGALVREGLMLLAVVGGPLLGVLLAVGLIVGILQAATQVSDPAVGFIPRLAAGLLACVLLGGWMIQRLATFFAQALERMGTPPG